MFNISTYKRFENESTDELIYRICQDKEKIGTWQDVANIINELTGDDYGESTYRKKYQSFQKMLSANQSKFADSESQLREIEDQIRELERMKIQFRDERRSWNKQNYENSRFDEVMNLLIERMDNFAKTDFTSHSAPLIDGEKNMIVCLSDLHIGQCFLSYFGEFNSDIAKERLQKYMNEILNIARDNHVKKAYVFMLGDNISNSLHKTIEVSNKENVIDQLKLSIEYISSFCYELTKHFEHVYLASASGNHSRLQAKDLAQHSERLDAFIAWDVCRTLQYVDNFHSLLHRSIDDGIADVNIDGKTYLLIHGDYDTPTKSGYLNLSNAVGFFPDYICCGHRHFCFYSQESKFIQSGSLASSGDDYCVEKRLSGKASQMVCIVDKTGVKSVHPVMLS
ncbi:hypothetical protein [[Clostridium] scindens]|uniref:hypothetical protein n=1 Tax=Clostridium scindens (strain JCM 10418 / VPI 12708) TaxID=29347 RepID=UPI001FAA85AD|nr:hypothetical protein [[Clostridium] scindens]